MIKANELRIGNWLAGTPKYPQRIAYVGDTIGLDNALGGTDKYQHNPIISFDINDLNPILITSEILEKSGFDHAFGNDPAHFYIGEFILIGHKLVIGEGYKAYSAPCPYVHTLQNLYFALTGEELAITL